MNEEAVLCNAKGGSVKIGYRRLALAEPDFRKLVGNWREPVWEEISDISERYGC